MLCWRRMVLTAKEGLTLKPSSSRVGTSQGQESFYLSPLISISKLAFPNGVHGLPFSDYTKILRIFVRILQNLPSPVLCAPFVLCKTLVINCCLLMSGHLILCNCPSSDPEGYQSEPVFGTVDCVLD